MDLDQKSHEPSTFPDGTPVLVMAKGKGPREKRFLLWVELNFEEESDFNDWMDNCSKADSVNKEDFKEWLDHYFPEASYTPRLMTLREALRMSKEDSFGNAREHLSRPGGDVNGEA